MIRRVFPIKHHFRLSLGTARPRPSTMSNQMDRHMQEQIAKIMSSRKASVPWQREQPYEQPYYSYEDGIGKWHEVRLGQTASTDAVTPSGSDFNFHLITWNIDMLAPLANPRMRTATKYLSQLCRTKYTGPLVILLQEMLESDLEILQSSAWVRDRFYMTDISNDFWESGYYGTCTLIDRRFSIKKCFRVHYEASNMERDALIADVALGDSGPVIRVVNTHLESLVADPPLRPSQLATAAKWMKASSEIGGTVLAGDLNAIQPFDRHIASENGLKDVFMELGGKEDADAGYTWGPLVPRSLRDKFGCSRMDKILFQGQQLQVEGLEKIGEDAEVEGTEDRKELLDLEQGVEDGAGQMHVYVTDHIGLAAEFVVAGSSE